MNNKTIEENLKELDNRLAAVWVTRSPGKIDAQIIFWGMSGSDHGQGQGATFVEALNDLFEDLNKDTSPEDRPPIIAPDWDEIYKVHKHVQEAYLADPQHEKISLWDWLIINVKKQN